MAHLVFVAGPNAGRRYKLHAGESVIGRRSDCQIFVPDMRVSRQHARVVFDAGRWRVEDLGSNNGTFVNGQRVTASSLKNEDEIQIANNRIRVEIPDGTTSSERAGFEAHVTIVEGTTSSVWTSRGNTEERRSRTTTGQLSSQSLPAQERAFRLVERKLDALTQILEAQVESGSPDQLIEKMVDALLLLYPQADSVGVLATDPESQELRVQCQRQRRSAPKQGMVVPATIISHVVAGQRSVLLGDTGAGDGGELVSGDNDAAGNRMGAPLVFGGKHHGVVYVESDRHDFHQEDVDLLGTVAAQTAMALHAADAAVQQAERDRLDRDLRVARQIQRSLLPPAAPSVVGLDFAIHYEPAYQIGGDFYDFIWHDQSHLALAIGDVSGKAISAALYMARLTSELRSRASIARTPARLLRRVNTEMVTLGDDGMFATLAYCMYDLETRSLVFTNAGHCMPLLRRGDRVFPLHADRAHIPPLGVVPELEAGEARVQLHSGDLLILITDGIIEARDPRGHEYGMARLSRRVRTARGSAEDVVKAILADIDAHAGTAGQSDDMTIVAMSIDERRAKRKTTTLPGVAPPEGPARLGTSSGEDTKV
ncbi:MAG: SpoIIE family protein phosphatase [Kofleriaceae bacterium]|jgi:sigma-B regulation protein RsbU (phosphoserine phosphatase)|nr:SpoIIE family protein phosphatase [Kofleriaceae bacterium]MBP6837895.1 SpoIIE family protein phosphatase [Kofleriaceae bacterium]MBP9205476.1 SpoIIE family protein phosphatase [Kofleriaceae bacterium]